MVTIAVCMKLVSVLQVETFLQPRFEFCDSIFFILSGEHGFFQFPCSVVAVSMRFQCYPLFFFFFFSVFCFCYCFRASPFKRFVWQRRGVVKGVDFGSTGEVKKVDVSRMHERLDGNCIVILSNLGYSSSGEVLDCKYVLEPLITPFYNLVILDCFLTCIFCYTMFVIFFLICYIFSPCSIIICLL